MARRLELNARVLAVMEDLGVTDASRLVYHASEAGDVDALVPWFDGRRADAEEAAEEATAVLGRVGDEGLFAFALSNQSQLAMLAHRTEEASTLARRAIALATAAGAAWCDRASCGGTATG